MTTTASKSSSPLGQLPKEFREALAFHWVLAAAFGIPTGDIFVAYNGGNPTFRFQVVVGVGTPRLFHIDVADEMTMPRSDFERDWSRAVRAYNEATGAERRSMVESTAARERAVELIAAMVAKGWAHPRSKAAL